MLTKIFTRYSIPSCVISLSLCLTMVSATLPAFAQTTEKSKQVSEVAKCYPECLPNTTCTVVLGTARCLSPADEMRIRDAATLVSSEPVSQCSPACLKDENCIDAANGPMCVISPRNCRPRCASTQTCIRGNFGYQCLGPEPAARVQYAPVQQYRFSDSKERHEHSNPAAAPAITLGVLYTLGGLGNLALASTGGDTAGVFVISGVIGLSLGIWGIAAGASDVSHR